MPMLQTREAAKRLARAIANDLELYNADRIAQCGGDELRIREALKEEIDEGRQLYESRVAEDILADGFYDAAIQSILINPHIRRSEAPAGGASPQSESGETDEEKAREIRTKNAANRLARAIAADLAIYNDDRIAQCGGDELRIRETLKEEIDEGRQLFEARTSASLHGEGLFERAIQDALIKPSGAQGESDRRGAASGAAAPDEHEAIAHDSIQMHDSMPPLVPVPDQSSQDMWMIVMVIVLVVMIAGAVGYFVLT